MDKKNIRNVGIFLRLSTPSQFECDTPEVHEERARAYAKFKGWNVLEKYEFCVSGKFFLKHSETRRMMDDIQSGRIQAIILSKLARLGRNLKDALEIADFFQKYNAHIISLKEDIDTSTAGGRLLFHVLAALAQWEGEETTERIVESIKTRAKMGKPLGGIAPFGFQWKNGKLMHNKNREEVIIAEDIFRIFLQCRKIRTTARMANEKGYRTRTGNLWSDTSIRRLLQDSTYKGSHRLNYTKSRGRGKGWDFKKQDEVVYTKVESIVTPELWNEVNTTIKSNARKITRRTTTHLLSGVVFCSNCDRRMYGYDYGRSKPYYLCTKCRRKVGIEELHGVVIDSLKKYEFDPQNLVNFPRGSLDKLMKQKTMLKKTHDDINKRIDELLELYHRRTVDEVTFKDRVKKYEERRASVINQIPKVEEEICILKIKNKPDVINSHVRTVGGLFPHLTFQEQRSIVEDLLESIVIGKDNIDLNLYLMPLLDTKTDLIGNCNESMSLWLFYRSIS